MAEVDGADDDASPTETLVTVTAGLGGNSSAVGTEEDADDDSSAAVTEAAENAGLLEEPCTGTVTGADDGVRRGSHRGGATTRLLLHACIARTTSCLNHDAR